jgi:preprotein translocase subunit SecG
VDTILLVLQVFLAVAIIGLILLQKGKGASEGATFGGGGGGGAGSVFGASGSSNFLSKTTAILATCFFLNSLALAYLAGNRDVASSVLDTIEVKSETGLSTEPLDGAVPPLPADTSIESDVPAAVDAPVESDVPPAAE